MQNIEYGDIPQGKYNKWCERKELVSSSRNMENFEKLYLIDNMLTYSEKAAYYTHELVNCQGLEFVAFSNAHIVEPISLSEAITLVPCFCKFESGDKDEFTREMERIGRFVYDGWLQILDWDKASVRKAVNSIYSALSVFCLRASVWFNWKPKYSPYSSNELWYEFKRNDMVIVDDVKDMINSLEIADSQALLTSIGWLQQSMKLEEPSAKFLFGILSIESLVNYIEDQASDNSVFRRLRNVKLDKETRKLQKEECIRGVMKQYLENQPEEAVKMAYFDCVGGIKKTIQQNLAGVFGENTDAVDLLFKYKADGKTLWELRSAIAHGNIDSLSEEQRELINLRAWDVERIARDYIRNVIRITSGIELPELEIEINLTGILEDSIFSQPGMYHGSINMAEIYSSKYSGWVSG